PAERLRRLDVELHIEIAHILAAQHRHALALEADALARLGAGRDLDLGAGIVERGYFEFPTQGRRGHGDRYAGIKIGPVALEQVVRADRDEDVEIARRAAPQARFAFIGQADARAVLDALGNVDA